MTISGFPNVWRRMSVLSAVLGFAACSSSSTTNDGAQVGDGSGDAASASSGKDTAIGGPADSVAPTDTAIGQDSPSGSTADSNTTGDSIIDNRGEDGGFAGHSDVGEPGGQPEGGQIATLFIPDDLDNVVYRYNITPGADPVLTATIANTLAYAPAVRSTGELFVANYLQAGTISRFLSPLGNPIPNGTIANVGIVYPDTMLFVDDELWIPNTALDCSTDATSLVRLAFDSQGNASAVGTVTSGMIGANRGMAWGPTTRDLFVSQCSPVDTVQHYRVASNHAVTPLAPITGNGMHNPAGMVVAPWGELLVANEGTGTSTVHGTMLLRFSVDAQGNVTPNGTITGNGMDSPFGLAFTPWGELIVCNNASGTLSRFTFDASRTVTPNGTFQLVAHHILTVSGTASIAIVPGASTMIAADGGAQ